MTLSIQVLGLCNLWVCVVFFWVCLCLGLVMVGYWLYVRAFLTSVGNFWRIPGCTQSRRQQLEDILNTYWESGLIK